VAEAEVIEPGDPADLAVDVETPSGEVFESKLLCDRQRNGGDFRRWAAR
jgi:hypothetical protein